ncbi:manganese efflux pump MntP family protein [Salsuginibacillus kocurii]|uniref:manganese efflux pump MntP n=1 Tax=Salsuginibacillus kocurii TaxID=427078 RepID=UPI00037CCDDF|nr:manganese efflux pump [Salsuginibacillus kocurii]
MSLFQLLFLAAAVSVDNFAVGSAYGARRHEVGWRVWASVGVVSGASFYLMGLFGEWVFRSLGLADGGIAWLHSLVFIGIGIYSCAGVKKSNHEKNSDLQPLKSWQTILFISVILSLDAAVMGAAVGGVLPLPIALTAVIVGLASAGFVAGGGLAGLWLTAHPKMKHAAYLPGIGLIVLGIYELFG